MNWRPNDQLQIDVLVPGGRPFDEVPHVMVRMCVAACILAMSGKLDELEAE